MRNASTDTRRSARIDGLLLVAPCAMAFVTIASCAAYILITSLT